MLHLRCKALIYTNISSGSKKISKHRLSDQNGAWFEINTSSFHAPLGRMTSCQLVKLLLIGLITCKNQSGQLVRSWTSESQSHVHFWGMGTKKMCPTVCRSSRLYKHACRGGLIWDLNDRGHHMLLSTRLLSVHGSRGCSPLNKILVSYTS
jgi:hypothetical protein